ncbi:transposase [Paracraurococcus lichenis]|uniref:Transposase n=1 Tax=Paracraurococcus lichenis TaxID=3064888 RepID=A0ABT9DYG5_9PROT|nr:transposase [Paracraurococcus sp. LOR1-02]MDO9708947.1 transposase [Paracraurococcus sp. LOR1-02]
MTPSEARRRLATGSHRRFTPKRPWAPMTDAEWAAVERHLKVVVQGQGRPLKDARQRIDGMFRIAASGQPWHALPPDYGKPDTVGRHFRRLARMGLWMRLVGACADRAAPAPLRAIEFFIVRAARRAMRLLGMGAAVMAEKLGMLSAMPVLPVYLTRPYWFAEVERVMAGLLEAHRDRPLRLPIGEMKAWLRLHRFFAGKPWHRRWAEP